MPIGDVVDKLFEKGEYVAIGGSLVSGLVYGFSKGYDLPLGGKAENILLYGPTVALGATGLVFGIVTTSPSRKNGLDELIPAGIGAVIGATATAVGTIAGYSLAKLLKDCFGAN